MDKDITWGGFSKLNIRRWIINECLDTDKPYDFFRAIEDVISDIRDEIDNYRYEPEYYWQEIDEHRNK